MDPSRKPSQIIPLRTFFPGRSPEKSVSSDKASTLSAARAVSEPYQLYPKKFTALRKEVIEEYLAERPHPFKKDLMGTESVREILKRLQRRNIHSGKCSEMDVRHWLSLPCFYHARKSAEKDGFGTLTTTGTTSPTTCTTDVSQMPELEGQAREPEETVSPTPESDLTSLVRKVVRETVARMNVVPLRPTLQPPQRVSMPDFSRSKLSTNELQALNRQQLSPERECDVFIEDFGMVVTLPASTVPVTWVVKSTVQPLSQHYPVLVEPKPEQEP